MSKFYERLKDGLEDVLAHKKGKITLRTETIEIPEPPAEYRAKDIKKIREKGRYSQSIFAKVLNVSIKTVQSWESGERFPSHAALRLLEIVDKGIYRPKVISKRAS
jgi:putative transcriptional regulator